MPKPIEIEVKNHDIQENIHRGTWMSVLYYVINGKEHTHKMNVPNREQAMMSSRQDHVKLVIEESGLPRCGNCDHHQTGRCYRYPPGPKHEWPAVHNLGCCGEWGNEQMAGE